MTEPFTVSTKHNRYLATGTSAVEAVVTVRAEASDLTDAGATDAPTGAPPSDWPDVRLRVWAQAGAQVTGLRQFIPGNRDVQRDRRAVAAGVWEHRLGAFAPGEERTYHLRLVDVGEHRETAGLPHAVGRVSVHLGGNDSDASADAEDARPGITAAVPVDVPVARSTIEAVWSDDPDALAERDADFGGGTMQQFMAGAFADAEDARRRAGEGAPSASPTIPPGPGEGGGRGRPRRPAPPTDRPPTPPSDTPASSSTEADPPTPPGPVRGRPRRRTD